MAKANSSFSEVQIARRIKEGRGQGHGKDYIRGVVTIYRTTPRPGSRSRLERIVRWRYLGRYQSASLLPVCPTLYREPLRDRHRNLLARRSHKHQARWPHA